MCVCVCASNIYIYLCVCVCVCVSVCVQENAGGSVQFDEVLAFYKTLQDCMCKIKVL